MNLSQRYEVLCMAMFDKITGAFSNTVDFELYKDQILAIGDLPTISNPVPKEKYICKFIDKNRRKITLSVSVLKGTEFDYKKGDSISLSYEELREMYVFTAKIENVFRRRHTLTEIDKELFKAYIDDDILQSSEILGISAVITSLPKSYDRRNYYRFYSPPWKIYFRIGENSQGNDEQIGVISAAQRELIESGSFEIDDDYCVIKPLDISGGGFRSQVDVEIPFNTVLDCMIIINNQYYSVSGIVLEYMKPFQMRVQFTHISQITRSTILKNIIEHERRMRIRTGGNR